jgi:uncharacterized phiE125 gp8 family phage protein
MPGYVLVTGPAEEPVDVSDARRQCRLTDGDDDILLDSLIFAARQYVEKASNLCLITQTWRYEDFGFPCEQWQPIRINKAPVQSITSIKYRDENDVLVTLDPSLYRLDNTDQGCYIWPPPNNFWPWPLPRFWNGPEVAALQVIFVAGFGDDGDSVPQPLKQAMLLLIGQWRSMATNTMFLRREVVEGVGMIDYSVTAEASGVMTGAADALISSYRLPLLA